MTLKGADVAESPETTTVYDVAVVGAGPAGVSAAINVRSRGRSVALLAGQAPFGRVPGPHELGNYAGFPAATGDELAAAFKRHLEAFEVTVTHEKVSRIVRDGGGAATDGFVLFGDGSVFRASTVVLATGVYLEGSIAGEEELVGQGVSYCVTCDGRLFRGRRAAFISFGSPGESEANELAESLGVDVTYLPQYAGDLRLRDVVRVREGEEPARLSRSDAGIVVRLPGGDLTVDTVFIYREAVAPRTLLDGLVTDGPHVVVDARMRTSVPGVFAGGDCTGEPYQVAKAVGQGQLAGLQAVYLLRERAEAVGGA